MIPMIFLILYTSVTGGSSFMNIPMQSMDSCISLGRNLTKIIAQESFSHPQQYRYENSNGKFDCLDTKNQIMFRHAGSPYTSTVKEVTIDLTK